VTRPVLAARSARVVLDSGWTYRLLTIALVAAAWQWYALEKGGLLIPTFTATAARFFELLSDERLWEALWVSNQALLWGFAIAVVIGIPTGLLMGRSRAIERFTDVYVNFTLVTPMAALIPLLLMSLGVGLASRIILVVLFAIPMVIVNTRAGVRQIGADLLEMGHSFGASERQLWLRVILPGAVPAIMAGIRIALGRAITAMVIIELLMVAVGLGGLIVEARGRFDPETLYAVVIVVVLEAMVLVSLARWVEGRLAPWATHDPLRAH
jgi:NitT/TauT family transport system permease protein